MRNKLLSSNRQEEVWGYLFIAPQFIGLIIFILAPVIASLYISFTQWDFMGFPKWVGLENYKMILSDPLTIKVFKNTVFFIMGNIPLTLLFSLIVALALNRKMKGVILYRTLYFMPTISSSVAVSLLWLWLYNPDMGLINTILAYLGIKGPGWLSSTSWAMPAIIIMTVWQGIGYNMVIILAGLKGIPEVYYEAAIIDGANAWSRFWRITLPMLSPTIFFIVTMGLINGFQMFNEAYMMTRGGPADATNVVVLYIYQLAFQFYKMGPAAVVSWLLFIIILSVTLLQFKISNRWVNYDV